ncbi:hypothetical protein HYC85_013657 [Camellia sinensis]|uniref:Uncharacterized protein n=1 Tax=Camellia sinensis TaxID=4442 RepID=A0A7J7H3Z1_CAMSI|nr:hypothetical protein HYC85_013657 [Camellia sinensis]
MYLVHWPVKLKPWANNVVPIEDEFERLLDLETTWAGMERCLDMGMCRWKCIQCGGKQSLENSVGITRSCQCIFTLGGPGNSWGSTAVIDNPIIQSIAPKHHATPAQTQCLIRRFRALR